MAQHVAEFETAQIETMMNRIVSKRQFVRTLSVEASQQVAEKAASKSRARTKRKKRPSKPSKAQTAVAPVVEEPKAVELPETVGSLMENLQTISSLQASLPSSENVMQFLNSENVDKSTTTKLLDLYRKCTSEHMSESFYTSAIETACETQNVEKAVEMLKEMIRLRIRPSIDMTSKILNACDAANAGKEYLSTIRTIRDSGMEVTYDKYHLVLNICRRSSTFSVDVDTMLETFKDIRQYSSMSIKPSLFINSLAVAARQWRVDVFTDLLVEMRLANCEPEIKSLTSIEPNRMDRALTVIEGVRAVGLDPSFGMHAILDAIRNRYDNEPVSKKLMSKTAKSFGSHSPHSIYWPVKPVPQILETLGAGLVLNQDGFQRLDQKQVNRFERNLESLPIDANMSINLRRQLLRMSIWLNSKRIELNMEKIFKEYSNGKAVIELANEHNFPPVSMMRLILKHQGMDGFQVKEALDLSVNQLSPRDREQLAKAKKNDSVYKSDAVIFQPPHVFTRSTQLEGLVANFIRSKGIRFCTEDDLKIRQKVALGRAMLTPDILFTDPVVINGVPIRWIDTKNFYGAHLVDKSIWKRQVKSYVDEWGPGAIVYSMGFSGMASMPGVIMLDTTPIPRQGWQFHLMRLKSSLFKSLHSIRKTEILCPDITRPVDLEKLIQDEENQL